MSSSSEESTFPTSGSQKGSKTNSIGNNQSEDKFFIFEGVEAKNIQSNDLDQQQLFEKKDKSCKNNSKS